MTDTLVPVTIRLTPDDKDFLFAQAEASGLSGGIAARLLIDLAIKRMRAGADYLDTLQMVKASLRHSPNEEVAQSHIGLEHELDAAKRALSPSTKDETK